MFRENSEPILDQQNPEQTEINLDNLDILFPSEEELTKEMNKQLVLEKKDSAEIKDKVELKKQKIKEILENLKQNIEKIKSDIRDYLSIYISVWQSPFREIRFCIHPEADFDINDEGAISIDLMRLSEKQDPEKEIIRGLTHELFHLWMREEKNESINESEENIETLKEKFKARIIEEGLAFLISGQRISDYHKQETLEENTLFLQGAHRAIEEVLSENDLIKFKEKSEKVFQNIGSAYVVGFETVRKLKNGLSEEEFKQFIAEFRNNSSIAIEKHQVLLNNN